MSFNMQHQHDDYLYQFLIQRLEHIKRACHVLQQRLRHVCFNSVGKQYRAISSQHGMTTIHIAILDGNTASIDFRAHINKLQNFHARSETPNASPRMACSPLPTNLTPQVCAVETCKHQMGFSKDEQEQPLTKHMEVGKLCKNPSMIIHCGLLCKAMYMMSCTVALLCVDLRCDPYRCVALRCY